MTPIQKRLIGLAAIVVTDAEEARLERIRRSGFIGDIKVTGRDLTTGLPATGVVNSGDIWPPDIGVREPVGI